MFPHNLSRAEAQQRARLIETADLRRSSSTSPAGRGRTADDPLRIHHDAGVHRSRRRAYPPGPDRRRAGLRQPRRDRAGPVRLRRLPDSARAHRGRPRGDRAGPLPLQPQRGGAAPVRRPGRPADLPLHPVRGGRRPAGVRLLRAAGPQGPVPGRACCAPESWTVVSNGAEVEASRRRSRRTPHPVRRDAADLDLSDRAGRRGLPPGARATGRPGRPDPDLAALPALGRRAPGRRGDLRDHRRAGSRCSRSTSATRTRSASTTRSSSRSTTAARWRTSAASRCATTTCSAAR